MVRCTPPHRNTLGPTNWRGRSSPASSAASASISSFQDQLGGNVDTVHNVRSGVWATTAERQNFEQRGAYDSDAYHRHENYKATGQRDKSSQAAGTLHDPYRDKVMGANEQRNLDHVISAKEVRRPARVLAGLSGSSWQTRAATCRRPTRASTSPRSSHRSRTIWTDCQG
jgi:hypothetical protein